MPAIALRSALLQEAGVRHGFATRRGGVSAVYGRPGQGDGKKEGDLNLGYTAKDSRENVQQNRAILLHEIFGGRRPLVTLHQVHSPTIYRVGREQASEEALLRGDGLMTDEAGLALGIQTADCVPVLVADRRTGAVAGFHAGWRGTLARIVEGGIERMRAEFGSNPEDMVAAIGPAIGPCCYAVGGEVEAQFEAEFAYAPLLFFGKSPQRRLDLAEANRQQLVAAGVRVEAVESLAVCTSCNLETFFSYRAEQGSTGRMLAVIGRA